MGLTSIQKIAMGLVVAVMIGSAAYMAIEDMKSAQKTMSPPITSTK